jgi:hypothetical protein
MAVSVVRISGPAYLSNAAANIYTPPAATINTVVRQLHFANKTSSAVTFSVYVGATGGSAGGTELFGTRTIAAFDTYDWYASPGMMMKSTDFLTGVASVGSAVTVTVMGEQVIVP